jgi:hypothetical protein
MLRGRQLRSSRLGLCRWVQRPSLRHVRRRVWPDWIGGLLELTVSFKCQSGRNVLLEVNATEGKGILASTTSRMRQPN